ncbi:MAG: hypothetical protein AAFV78_20340, partial [Bacteroidota bacterium]
MERNHTILRGLSAILLFLLALASYAQVDAPSKELPQRTFSKDQLQKDFEVFRGSLEDLHAGLYWYTPKEELDQLFDETGASLNDSLSELAFFRKLTFITSKIRCGHTVIRTSIPTRDFIAQEAKLLPFEIKMIKGKMYMMESRTDEELPIKPGMEIIKINAHTVDALLQLASAVVSSDGFIENHKLIRFERNFPFFYVSRFGPTDVYEIDYLDLQGQKQSANIKARPTRQIKPLKRSERNLSLSFPDQDVALLKVRQFGNWKEAKKNFSFEKELHTMFEEISSAQVNNLVIDMRGNLGGDDNFGLR